MEKMLVTVEFFDESDLVTFLRYVERAKKTDGTVSGLYAGLVCSALKRAQIVKVPQFIQANAK